MTTRIRTVP